MGACESNNNTSSSKGGRGKGGGKNRPTKGGGKGKGGKGKGGRRPRPQTTSESSSESSSDDSEEDEKPQPKPPKNNKDVQPQVQPKQMDTTTNYPPVPQEDLDLLFYKAFTTRFFSQVPVPQELLRNAMKLALLAPTAYNCCPMRVIFCTTPESRQKLITTLDEKNVRQASEAPVIAIVCTDDKYTHYLPRLMPYVPNAQQMFEQYEDLNEMIKIRNSNLQAGYLILALRSLNLGVGPLSGFDNAACERLFLANTTWKANILLCIGYPDPQRQPQNPSRAYRLPFDVAAKLIQ